MSSNIRVTKVCEYCGTEFEARTTVTKYCSHICNKRAYKAIKRGEKITEIKQQVAAQRSMQGPSAKQRLRATLQIADINSKILLTVKEAALYMGCGRHTVHAMIRSGRLYAVNLGARQTRIRREDIDQLIEKPAGFFPIEHRIEHLPLKKKNCYTLGEILLKYEISESLLRSMLEQHNIRKQPFGQSVIVPKVDVDRMLTGLKLRLPAPVTSEDSEPFIREACYTISEVEALFGLAPSAVYRILQQRGVRKQRHGKSVFVRKKEIDPLVEEWKKGGGAK